jgi:hypothetical protein
VTGYLLGALGAATILVLQAAARRVRCRVAAWREHRLTVAETKLDYLIALERVVDLAAPFVDESTHGDALRAGIDRARDRYARLVDLKASRP